MDSIVKKIMKWLWVAPLLVVILWCGKNFYYFGVFGTSSWGTMSFSKMTTLQLSTTERDSLIRIGKLSKLSSLPPFPSLWRLGVNGITSDTLRVAHYPNTPRRLVYSFDATNFERNGRNMNHWLYLYISEQLKKDNTWTLNHRSGLYYMKAIPNAVRICFKPSWSWFIHDAGAGSSRRARNLDVLDDKYRLYWTGVDWGTIMAYIISIGGGLWVLKEIGHS